MKVLVTGATGFVGSHLGDQLINDNHEVRCLIRNPSSVKWLTTNPNIEIVKGDIQDADSLRSAVQQSDAIVHCAGLTKTLYQREYFLVNSVGTANLLAAAEKYATNLEKFILISSLAAQGPDITSSPNPVSYYGLSKLLAEQHALNFRKQLPVTIIRPPVVYGPRDVALLPFYKSIKMRLMCLPLKGKISLSVIYVDDLTVAIMQSLKTNTTSGKIYYVDDGHSYQLKEMLKFIATSMETSFVCKLVIPGSILKLSAIFAESYGRLSNSVPSLTRDKVIEMLQPRWVCDAKATRSELNWFPRVTLEEGVHRTYQWYKSRKWL